jgi:hypothetical protein
VHQVGRDAAVVYWFDVLCRHRRHHGEQAAPQDHCKWMCARHCVALQKMHETGDGGAIYIGYWHNEQILDCCC